MKFQFVLLGVLCCLVAQAAGKPSQVTPPANKSATGAQQSLKGCIDEQDGHYVLLDDLMVKITGLQSESSDKEIFAKYLGRKVQLRGTGSFGQNGMFKVTSIGQVTGNCGPAK